MLCTSSLLTAGNWHPPLPCCSSSLHPAATGTSSKCKVLLSHCQGWGRWQSSAEVSHEQDSTPPATDCSLEMERGAQVCIFGKICAAFCREGFLCRLCSPLSLDQALKRGPAKLRSCLPFCCSILLLSSNLCPKNKGNLSYQQPQWWGEGVVTSQGKAVALYFPFWPFFCQLSELQAGNLSYQSLFQHYTNKRVRAWKQSQAKEGQKAASPARPLLRMLLLE